jgi:hypothetical protein
MRKYFFLLLFITASLSAQQNVFLAAPEYNLKQFKIMEKVFIPPDGYQRVRVQENSFAGYLRRLPVVPDSFAVFDFKSNVRVKSRDSTLAAVIPVDIKGRNLWQCMDILQVFYMDWLFRQKKDSLIIFPLPDGTTLSWHEWRLGIRAVFKGLNFQKTKNGQPLSDMEAFRRYSNFIFEHSGTQTFWHYYPPVALQDIFPGDFIVKKGKKGHAVLIMDLAVNSDGEKIALIGQGDTPACQFYLLKKNVSPWFKIDENQEFPDLPIAKQMYWNGLRRF